LKFEPAIQHNQGSIFAGDAGFHQQQQQQMQTPSTPTTRGGVFFPPATTSYRCSTPLNINSQGGFFNASPAPGDSMQFALGKIQVLITNPVKKSKISQKRLETLKWLSIIILVPSAREPSM